MSTKNNKYTILKNKGKGYTINIPLLGMSTEAVDESDIFYAVKDLVISFIMKAESEGKGTVDELVKALLKEDK